MFLPASAAMMSRYVSGGIEGYPKSPASIICAAAEFGTAYIRMEGRQRVFTEAVSGTRVKSNALPKQGYGDWEFEVKDPNGYIPGFQRTDGK